MIAAAEEFLQGPTKNSVQPVPTATGPVTEMFRPKLNLKPVFLDKLVTHLEVVKFIQGAEVYITTGFTSAPPTQGTRSYLLPLMHVTWSNALEKAGAKDKDLKTVLKMLVDESQLRNPVHERRIEFIASKRGTMSHSDFFDMLEEKLELIEFDKLTPDSLVTHIFLQESDSVLTKVASDILYEIEGKGDIARLRNEIKLVEASQWYTAGRRHDGKKVGEGVGSRWCEKCQSTTHNTDACWGTKECKICGKKGHLAAQCWKNPANFGAGTVKSAQLTSQTPAPTVNPQEEAAKKAKQERNKKIRQKQKALKKKQEEEEAKRAAAEAKSAQSATHTASSRSST